MKKLSIEVNGKKVSREIGDNTIEGDGVIQLSHNPKFKFRIRSEGLQTVSLGLPVLAKNRSGTARFDLSGSGVLGKKGSVNFRGDLGLKDLVFEVGENCGQRRSAPDS